MEKRVHYRVPFEHMAKIHFQGKAIPCLLRDFCPGGVLVDLESFNETGKHGIDGATFGSVVEMTLDADRGDQKHKLNFKAEVRHQKQGAVGLKFCAIDKRTLDLLKDLAQYTNKQHSIEIDHSIGADSAEVKSKPTVIDVPDQTASLRFGAQLLAGYRRVILESLPVAIERGMRVAADKLLMTMNESADAWLRADFNLSLQMIETRGHWIAERVSQKVTEELATVVDGAAQTRPNESSARANPNTRVKLEVMQKDAFEDWLAVNMAIRAIENEVGYDLGCIATVLSQISGRKMDVQSCPVGPDFILKTLSAAFSSLELPSSSQPLIFKTIGKILQNELRDIYAVMLAGAERFGFDLKAQSVAASHRAAPERTKIDANSDKSRKNKPAASVSEGTVSVADAASPKQPATVGQVLSRPGAGSTLAPLFNHFNGLKERSGADHDHEGAGDSYLPTMGVLRNLIQLGASVGKGGSLVNSSHRFEPTENDLAGRPSVDRAHVLEAVSRLQSETDSEAGEAIFTKPLLTQLTQVLQSSGLLTSETALAQDDSSLINITDQLFSSILGQNGLNEVLKKWIEKLKLSILKVILLDNTFFSNSQHPARLFINQLAKLGSVKRATNTGLEKTLEHFTSRVINEYTGDNAVFEDALKEINLLVERQEKAFERNADRIARTYEGQQKLARARHQVTEEIAERLVGKDVPKLLLEFLEVAGWRQFLVVTLLREGARSDTYNDALGVIDTLFKWLSKDGGESRNQEADFEMDLEAPTLFDMVDRELASAGQTGYQRILNKMKAAVLEDEVLDTVPLEEYRWTGEGADEIVKLERSEAPRQLSRWEKRATSLSVGDWIEFELDGEERQRMRLAWSGTNSYRFVFVSSQGLRDVDITLDDFAEGIKEGRFKVLDADEVPLVDQGLHNMVQSVYEDLAGQASCDPLTGVLSRQEFERYMARAVADTVTHKMPYFIAYLDIDQFRVVNNSYGHLAGDHMLKHVARLMSTTVGPEVICGRLGGNEFGLIFRDMKRKTLVAVLDRIRNSIMNTPFAWENNNIYTTVSIGYAEINPKSDNLDSVMRKAYLACESAKDHGRNRIIEYALHDKDQMRQDEMMVWVKRIENSLDDFLVLRCQEIRPIRDGERKSHYEILLGVRDEQGNLLPPVNLIEAAEHYGRMARIDRWVVHNSLAWMENNPKAVANIDGISINLSGTSIGDEHFLEFVLGELAACNIPKDKICFEITETSAITSLNEAIEFISVLKKRGCKFALDDFGTGLSSYAYIQRLPVDYLKIDGVFIRNITNNQKDEALVRSINDLAHFMGMKTTAEYVENDEIFELLGDIGIDKAQGFGVHKPMLLDQLVF